MPPLQLRLDPAGFRDAYVTALPFPHAVFDGLFADEVLDAVLSDFPQPQGINWVSFDSATEKKLGYSYKEPLGETLRSFMFEMSSAPVLEFLERLTGIEGLIPDPYFGGAGPHQIVRGGFLKVHADFNWHPLLKLDRRLNLIVYLNKRRPHRALGPRHARLRAAGPAGLQPHDRLQYHRLFVPRPSHPAGLSRRHDPQVGLLLLLLQRQARRRAVGAARYPVQEDP